MTPATKHCRVFSMHHALTGFRWVQGMSNFNSSAALFYSNMPSTAAPGTVPQGHIRSDLSPSSCHIGLGRRRNLSYRHDLLLWKGEKCFSLAELLHGKKVILVGFPGGSVCTDQHIPGYVQCADLMAKKGVDQVVCITHTEPATLEELVQKHPQLRHPMFEVLADRTGGFVRLMGLELGDTGTSGPKSQRYAGIVDSGVLLKLNVEKQPSDLKSTDAQSMLSAWEEVYEHPQK